MQQLSMYDAMIFLAYFLALAVLGIHFKNKASRNMENYFLGGRQLPWWALGISGMSSFIDLTGTMVIVSFLYMLGPRGLLIEFRGGAVLILAVMMLWSGKWHRRSGCMTNAQWMIYRFGDTPGGHFARISGALAVIISSIGMVMYLIKGTSLFVSMFMPISPEWCVLIMIGITTLYIVATGFYGVVYMDLFQTVVMLTAVTAISVIAFCRNPGGQQLATLAGEVTGQWQWTQTIGGWKATMPRGYEQYSLLYVVGAFYLFRSIIFGMGAGGEPRYFGAKNDKECGKLTFLWITLMMVRWPMVMAFAVLGLFLVKDLFPDQGVLNEAAMLIKAQVGQMDKSRWAETISSIINSSGQYPPELLEKLAALMGDNWRSTLHLLSYEGTVDAERILPAVLLHSVPAGWRGIILVAMVAASLTSFGSLLNWTTGFFTKDIYQAYLRPRASDKELIKSSWIFGFVFVGVSFICAFSVKNINEIWDWFIMALGGGLVAPSILRFYWWRFTGGGYAVGTITGLVSAIVLRCGQVYGAHLSPWLATMAIHPASQFFVTLAAGLGGAIIGTYLTRPTDHTVLEHFYQTTRPFGWWGSLVDSLDPNLRKQMKAEHRRDVLALPFALLWQITLFILPMQLIIKNYHDLFITLIVFLASLLGLYGIWLRHLGDHDEN